MNAIGRRAVHQDVVDAVVDQILADGVEPPGLRAPPAPWCRRRRCSAPASAAACPAGHPHHAAEGADLPTESAVRVPATAAPIRALAASALAEVDPGGGVLPADVTRSGSARLDVGEVGKARTRRSHVVEGHRRRSRGCRTAPPRTSPSRRRTPWRAGVSSLRDRPGARQVAHEPAGEGVARAGRIEHSPRAGRPARRRCGSGSISSAPYSPCLITTRLGPCARIQRPARWMFQSPDSSRASLSLTIRMSTRREQLEQRRLLALDPVVHRVAHDQRGPAHLVEHAELQLGIDVAEEEELGVAERRRAAWAGSRRTRRAGSPASPGSAGRRSTSPSSGSSRPRRAPRRSSRCRAARAARARPPGSRCRRRRPPAPGAAATPATLKYTAEPPSASAVSPNGREDRVERDAADDEQAHPVTSGRGRRGRAG